jgi:hypothetical protein
LNKLFIYKKNENFLSPLLPIIDPTWFWTLKYSDYVHLSFLQYNRPLGCDVLSQQDIDLGRRYDEICR